MQKNTYSPYFVMNKIRYILTAIFVLLVIPYVNGQRIDTKVLVAFETKDYVIRVDSLLSEGAYRYSSWKKNKTLQNPPDIEIIGDIYDSEKHCYIFIIGDIVEGEYDYMVYDNKKKGFNGIIVTRNNKVILKQARTKKINLPSKR